LQEQDAPREGEGDCWLGEAMCCASLTFTSLKISYYELILIYVPIIPLLLNFALEHAIKKVQENKRGIGIEWVHRLLFYADDVNFYSVKTQKPC
jgi:hypothetical protein